MKGNERKFFDKLHLLYIKLFGHNGFIFFKTSDRSEGQSEEVEKKGLKLMAKKCLTGEIFLLSKITRCPCCES